MAFRFVMQSLGRQRLAAGQRPAVDASVRGNGIGRARERV